MSPFIRRRDDTSRHPRTRAAGWSAARWCRSSATSRRSSSSSTPQRRCAPATSTGYNDCHGSHGGVSTRRTWCSPRRCSTAAGSSRSRDLGHFWDIGGMRAGSISPMRPRSSTRGSSSGRPHLPRGVLNDEAFRIFLAPRASPHLQATSARCWPGCRLGERRVARALRRFAPTRCWRWALFRAAVSRHNPQDAGVDASPRHLEERDAVDGDGIAAGLSTSMRLVRRAVGSALDIAGERR